MAVVPTDLADEKVAGVELAAAQQALNDLTNGNAHYVVALSTAVEQLYLAVKALAAAVNAGDAPAV